MVYESNLYHHGIKGQKWGVRRYQNPDGTLTDKGKKRYSFGEDGSEKSVKKLNKMLEADKKYGQNRTLSQDKKVKKLYKQYDQSLSKDIKKAMKLGDEKAYNNMVSGRTYLKMIMDSNFLSMAVNDAAVRANAPLGKELTYNVLRDKDLGTVKVTVNGVSSDYVYMPEWKNNKANN